jgi:hypothetical protein
VIACFGATAIAAMVGKGERTLQGPADGPRCYGAGGVSHTEGRSDSAAAASPAVWRYAGGWPTILFDGLEAQEIS